MENKQYEGKSALEPIYEKMMDFMNKECEFSRWKKPQKGKFKGKKWRICQIQRIRIFGKKKIFARPLCSYPGTSGIGRSHPEYDKPIYICDCNWRSEALDIMAFMQQTFEANLAEIYDEYLEEYYFFGEYDEELHGEPIHPFDETKVK